MLPILAWFKQHVVLTMSSIGAFPLLRWVWRWVRQRLDSAWDDRLDNWTNRFIDRYGVPWIAAALTRTAHSYFLIPLGSIAGIVLGAYFQVGASSQSA